MAASSSAAALVVPALKRHTATVIFCHGLGDSGAGWLPVAENWLLRGKFEHVKFIFPNAPMIPITVNFGMKMPGWYDITTFDDLQQKSQDETGIMRSRDYILNLVNEESRTTEIPTSRILIGGFSQGGALSLFTGISSPVQLAGVVGLSSYLLFGEKAKDNIPENGGPNKQTPFFMGHGDRDPLVKHEWGSHTAEMLKEFGFEKVDFNTYRDLEHSAAPKEIDDLENFIKQRLPDVGATESKA